MLKQTLLRRQTDRNRACSKLQEMPEKSYRNQRCDEFPEGLYASFLKICLPRRTHRHILTRDTRGTSGSEPV
jgi:hypothetical protein